MNDRRELAFAVHYSIALCEMHARLWRRVGVGLYFLQTVLGLWVLAGVGDVRLLGGLFVLVSTGVCIWQPEVTALVFTQQRRKYQVLCCRMGDLDEAALGLALSEISERDLPELGLLTRPAELRTAIRMGASSDICLTWAQKWASWLAGDHPRR